VKTKDWVILFAALVIAASGMFMAVRPRESQIPVTAAETKDQQVIAVNGEAILTVKPDTVTISIGVTTQAASAQASMAANASRMNSLISTLTAAGIKNEEMRTLRFNVRPDYEYKTGAAARLVGFTTSNTLQFSVPATTNVGQILDKAAAAGANVIESVTYQVKDLQKYRDEALAKAMADAKRRADVLAKSAGVTIKGIKSVSESGGGTIRSTEFSMARSAKAIEDTPLLAGEMTIQFSVRVEYTF